MYPSVDKQKEFVKLCNKVADFLDENFSPYTRVVIDANAFVVKEDIMDGYFEIRVKEKE